MSTLYINDNEITNLSPLAGLSELSLLNVRNNQITTLTPLAGVVSLAGLDIGSNAVTCLSPLTNLVNLTILYFNNNEILSISPLTALTNLNNLKMSYNLLNLSPGSPALAQIQSLESNGATVVYLPQSLAALPLPERLSAQQFAFTLSGATNLAYQVQYTTNLVAGNWIALGNVTNVTGTLLFTDSSATNAPRFYRFVGPSP